MKKRLIALLLVVASLATMLTGCMEAEITAPLIVPEQQIFDDKYERNEDITEFLTFRYDYLRDVEEYAGQEREVIALYDHMHVQVDNWESVIVGKTTMGEIVKIIDGVNENYVTEKTNALIAERQAAIDAAYEEAKAAAEAKGKEYTKEKKEPRTDDIHFDNPYIYSLVKGDVYNPDNNIVEEYQATMLLDPLTYDTLYLDVVKYGIPYVRFEFRQANPIYNYKITQEADWVLNGVQAADVSAYTTVTETEEGEVYEAPDFVDVDGRNKAAKRNIVMSGDIAFGGEGFTWETLKFLFNALNVKESDYASGECYVESSDEKFTYYEINILANNFEFDGLGSYAEPVLYTDGRADVYQPFIRLIATFDPLSQVCINWTIDMYTTYNTVMGTQGHDFGETTKVNVHEYQIDTNDYEGMRQSIKEWIEENSNDIKLVYCAKDSNAKDKNDIMGIVESSILDAEEMLIIDGEEYVAIDAILNKDGTAVGKYMTAKDVEKANEIEDEESYAKFLESKTINISVECYIADSESDEILMKFNPNKDQITNDVNGKTYFLAKYTLVGVEYVDVCYMEETRLYDLVMKYAKTYHLDEAETNTIIEIMNEQGIEAIQTYIDNKFADAEAAQKEQQDEQQKPEEGNDEQEQVETFVSTITPTHQKANAYPFKEWEGWSFNNRLDAINTETQHYVVNIGGVETYTSSWDQIKGLSIDEITPQNDVKRVDICSNDGYVIATYCFNEISETTLEDAFNNGMWRFDKYDTPDNKTPIKASVFFDDDDPNYVHRIIEEWGAPTELGVKQVVENAQEFVMEYQTEDITYVLHCSEVISDEGESTVKVWRIFVMGNETPEWKTVKASDVYVWTE